jgi:CubicO group peptidase (beta-lactamase class C family)
VTGVRRSDALAERLRALLGRKHQVVAAATVAPGEVHVTSIGAARGADFEIGSISKGVTGLLYADAVDRGEITPSTTLGDLLPLDGAAAAGLTLGSLAVHRSGLPRLPASASPIKKTLSLLLNGTNPYGEDVDELVDQARLVMLRATRARYSNLGFELLGHALAGASGMSYAQLVRRRIADTLGLTTFYVPGSPAELRPSALLGRSRLGRAQQPWTGEAIGPTGGIRASIEDMARLVQSLLNGTAPGIAALGPVDTLAWRGVRIGAAWITMEVHSRSITWHNGGTGGFRSWLGLDRDAGTGAVVLSAISASVDRAGFRLLAQLTREAPTRR